MTPEQVISKGLGEIACPHGSPVAEMRGNTVISIEVDLPARHGERRVRTEFLELSPAQYKQWSDRREIARYAAEIGLQDEDLDGWD